MDDLERLTVGAELFRKGDITQNTWVGARSARALEASLGFGPGRLSAGWAVLVLKQKLRPDEFEFAGLTIRSGGRAGLPAASLEADALRPRVHSEVLARAGAQGYRAMQIKVLASIPEKGAERLVKVVPAVRHSGSMAPKDQYPMGGGGLQWTLTKACRFVVAMTVDENAIAVIPGGFSAFLGESALYESRAKLNRYICNA